MKRILICLGLLVALAGTAFCQDAITIYTDGNVGIGTDSDPTEKLVVNGRVKDQSGFITPVGAIIPYSFSTAPEGWLICNGDLINKAVNPEYAELVDALKAEANGNANHPFYDPDPDCARLPDLRGRFVRGYTEDSLRDPGAILNPANANDARVGQGGQNVGAAIGSLQSDAFQGHIHQAQRWSATIDVDKASEGTAADNQATWLNTTGPRNDGTHGAPRISSETRPVNVYVNFIIKF